MAYTLMKRLIAIGKKSNSELHNYNDVYYAAGRLTDEQYTEINALIDEKVPAVA